MAEYEYDQERGIPTPTGRVDIVRSSPVCVVTAGGGWIFQSQPSVSRAVLTLTARELECRDERPGAAPRTFLLEDLVGVYVNKLPFSHNKAACQMNVHTYPLLKKSAKKRKMVVLSVGFDSKETFEDNRTTALGWKKEIQLYSSSRLRQVLHNIEDGVSEVSQRHFLVLINPVCGKGKAEGDFREHVQPLFDLAEINCSIVVTERQNHAREMMKEYDLSSIDGIAIVSGDGLLYEVVNGLMEREDWEQAIKTPIGMLPSGSGNALCASTLYEAGEEFSLENAAFQIIQGGVIPMDITTVKTADQQTHYMTLLGSWGMIADIDIESERFRNIGESRFVLGALNCIRRKRIYRGRLVYLPYDGSEDSKPPFSRSYSVPSDPTSTSAISCADLVTTSLQPELLTQALRRNRGDTAETVEGDPPLLSSTDSERKKSGPQDMFDKGEGMLEELHIGRVKMTGAMGRIEEEGNDAVGWVEGKQEVNGENSADYNVKETQSVSPVTIEKQTSVSSTMCSGPNPHLLAELKEPIPENWKVVEGEFLSITPIMVSHLTTNFFGDPNMSIGTGKIRILYFKKMSRFGMLGMLTGADKGKHLNRSEANIIDVKAFRLEPYTEEGIMTVDGEVVKYGPMQAQVHQHLARVFCSKKISQDAQLA